MIKWAIKKYIIGKLNDMLDLYKDDVSRVKGIL